MTDPYGDFLSLDNENTGKTFAIIGVGGYIAPKHLEAIKNVNGKLLASLDINDSVGILDKYFLDSEFFTDEDEFFNFVLNNKINYVSICSPNYLHHKHIKQSLYCNCDVVCEKPTVIKIDEYYDLLNVQKQTNKKIFTILQLRLSHQAKYLKQKIEKNKDIFYEIDINYITPRGNWYLKSWKNNKHFSGGILFNIGIHFFDLLFWLFGDIKNYSIELLQENKAQGTFKFNNAKVNWFLSVDKKDSKFAQRTIKINNEKIDLSNKFKELHTLSYKEIFNNNGFLITDIYKPLNLIIEINKKYG